MQSPATKEKVFCKPVYDPPVSDIRDRRLRKLVAMPDPREGCRRTRHLPFSVYAEGPARWLDPRPESDVKPPNMVRASRATCPSTCPPRGISF